MKIQYISSIALIIISLSHVASSSERSINNQLGEVVGNLLTTTDILERLSKTDCSYLIKKNYNVKSSINKIILSFPKNEQPQLSKIFRGKGFTEKLEQNIKLINGYFEAGKKDGLDKKTLCGMFVAKVSTLHQSNKTSWITVKKAYFQYE